MYRTGILIWVYASVAELVIAALLGWLLPYVPKKFERLCKHHLVIAKAHPEKAIKYRASQVNWVGIFTLVSIVMTVALVVIYAYSGLRRWWRDILVGVFFMPTGLFYEALLFLVFILAQNQKEARLEKYYLKKYGIKVEGEGII